MFNVFPPTVPGFRVRPHDDVPGFDIDENGLPRRERPWSDGMGPGSTTPQYPDLAQAMMATPRYPDLAGAMMSTPGPEDSVQPTPPQLPDWLHTLLTMPLPTLPGSVPFAPLGWGLPAPIGTLFNPGRSFPTTDQNVREMGDVRADVARVTPPPALRALEEPGMEQPPSFDAPKPLVDVDAGHATPQNANPQPVDQDAMGDAWPQPPNEGQPQPGVARPQDLSGTEMARQPTGAPPSLSIGSTADPNIVPANAADDDLQEAQQTQQPGRNTPRPAPQRPDVQPKPSDSKKQPSPLRQEKTGEELTQLTESRREQAFDQRALNEAYRYKAAREERRPYWDYMLRQLPRPPFPGSKIQEPLPLDWRTAVRKIAPGYLDYTEAAAKKYGIPPELLARLLYRESSYKNEGVDENGNPIRGHAVGIPQMYGDALRDVGVDPRAFARAGAAAQIDAGAAYLARQYRRFGDWPRAVAAYHFGADRVEAWLAGKGITYDNIKQRTEGESAFFRGNALKEREEKAGENATKELNQWRELQGYLPYVFLGDPSKYDRRKAP